jgi:DNA (cytosine-5)-methyltransferase 1
MDYSKLTRKNLLQQCKESGIKKYSTKSKPELIQLLTNHVPTSFVTPLQLPAIETTINITLQTPFRFIDLFCGIGGFHQAMSRIGGSCVFACDIDEQCRKTYEENYGIKPAGDISKLDIQTIPNFDILCGGFPCQSFSNSGNKKGLSDKRGQLFEYILQIALLRKPAFMFLENVKHILKIDDGKAFTHIKTRIQESGYKVDTIELSPHQLGVPQQRERVIFICVRDDLYKGNVSTSFTLPVIPIQVNAIFETDPTQTSKYKISTEDEAVLTAWDEMIQLFETNETISPTIMCNEFYKSYLPEKFRQLPDWKQHYITKNKPLYLKYKEHWDKWYAKHRQLISHKEIYAKLEWQAGKKKEGDTIFNQFIQFRQSGIRVKKCEYFPTLVAIVQTPIYAKEKRYITPRECARLQSFPDSFKIHENDHTAYKQFGNAVNVEVVHFVMYNTLHAYQLL